MYLPGPDRLANIDRAVDAMQVLADLEETMELAGLISGDPSGIERDEEQVRVASLLRGGDSR